MSELQNPDAEKPGRPQGTLPPLCASGEDTHGESPAPATPAKAPGKVSGGDPVAICLASMRFGEAPRVGCVGDTGTGKSRAMRALAAGWLARNPGLILALDKGGASGFEGQRRVSVSDLQLHPMATEPRAVVFTGDLAAWIDPDPEEVARLAWRLRARRTGSLVVVDELKWCARASWWKRGTKYLPQICSEGRKHDVGILWGTQSPQDAPREAIEEAGILVVFRLAGLGVRCLRDRDYLLGMPDGTLESLPGEESPPSERGRCVILRRGHSWDGRFHRFP
jgi:hypothetical protein